MQIDDQFRFLKVGARVVDLGAAPGGWTQVAVERVKPERGKGIVIGIDLTPVEPIAGATVLAKDFYDEDAPAVLTRAARRTGRRGAERHGRRGDRRHADRSPAHHGAGRSRARLRRQVLKPGGTFVAKVLRGGTERTLLDRLKHDFAKVRHAKPEASRADSAEMYVVGTGFRG